MRNLIDWLKTLCSGKPHFTVGGFDRPYLQRWYLIPRNRFLNVYLHKFLRDDDDRALHDHPWRSLSIVLRGGYYEHCDGPDGRQQFRWVPPGSFVYRPAEFKHRIELRWDVESEQEKVPAWTLFITGPKVRTWGFWCPQGFIPWMDFVDRDDSGSIGRGCDQ